MQTIPRLAANPALGFPQALVTEAETEAFYRLLRNPRVHYGALMEPHALSTVERMEVGATIRVVHDTTEFQFSGEVGSRDGLGRVRSEAGAQGFLAHVSLALSTDAIARPLGVVGLRAWARDKPSRANRKLSAKELSKIPNRESARWGTQITQVEKLVGGRAELVHIADREADTYPLLAQVIEEGSRFVFRMAQDRRALPIDEWDESEEICTRLSELVNDFRIVVKREIPLRKRSMQALARNLKTKDAREQRTAELALRAGRLELRRPSYCSSSPETIEVNVVYVEEVGVPVDMDPISWVLVTSEPITTAADVEAVVDHYRARWTIEEFFKALKTGCAFEERQLESFDTLTNALALFVPIAWQMLLIRTMARTNPKAPATSVLDATQIAILQHVQPQKMPKKDATVQDALYAIAGLGGHLKNNGPPGWLTLARGMETLTTMTLGALALTNARNVSS